MSRSVQPARWDGGSPNVELGQYKSGETFLTGYPLIYDSGELKEGGTDPTAIAGISAHPAGQGAGQQMGLGVTQVTGLGTRPIHYYRADTTTVWSSPIAASGAITTPALTDLGVAYGLIKVGTQWCVDRSDTSNTRLVVTDIDIDNKLVFWRFLPAHIV